MTNYNGERYLPALLDSIKEKIYNQNHNIEVLVMDDLSSDNSEEICGRYNFVQFVKTDINRGQSFQRNKGLSMIKGEYFMFIDNDDIFHSSNVFNHIKYMEANGVDIVESRMQTFATEERLEQLKKIDFPTDYSEQDDKAKFQYQAVWNKIYKSSVKGLIHFDETRRFGEDLLVTYYLKLNKNLTIMSTMDVFILYRKMNEVSVSSNLSKDKFLLNIGDFLEIFNHFDDVPMYLYYKQYIASYIYLSKVELDQDIIDLLFSCEKLEAFYMRFRFWNNIEFGELQCSKLEYLTLLDVNSNIEEQELIYQLGFNKSLLTFQQYIKTVHAGQNLIYVRKAYEREGRVYTEIETIDIQELTILRDDTPSLLRIPMLEVDKLFSVYANREVIRYVVEIDITDCKKLEFKKDGELMKIYNSPNSVLRKKVPTRLQNKLYGIGATKIHSFKYSLVRHIYNELKAFRKDRKVKDFAYRMVLNVANKIYRNKLVFLDRPQSTGDNAETFLRYIKENNKPEYKNTVLLLSKKADNYDEISQRYNVVDFDSFKAKLLLNSSKYVFSSFIDLSYVFPVPKKYIDLQKRKYVYLQHGVNSFEMTKVFNGASRTVDNVICTTHFEMKEFAHNKFNYFEERVKPFGMPRLDYLTRKESKVIYFCPTWRPKFLTNGGEGLIEDFDQTEFYTAFMKFIGSEKLHDVLEKNGYELKIKLHPYFDKVIKELPLSSSRVSLVKHSYDQVFEEATIMVSDYSSVIYDAAYNGTKTILFWPDEEEFFNSCHYDKGDFDHKNDGISPIFNNVEDLVHKIDYYIANPMEEKYVANKKKYFINMDKNNAQRSYDYFFGGVVDSKVVKPVETSKVSEVGVKSEGVCPTMTNSTEATKSEKIDFLVDFEKSSNIYDIEEQGVKFYPYVRNLIFDKVFYSEKDSKNLSTNAVTGHFIDKKRLFSSIDKPVDVVLVSLWRHEMDENGAFDKITRKYKDDLLARGISFAEVIIGFRGETIINDENTYYITDLNILKLQKLEGLNLDFPVLNKLCAELGIEISRDELITVISASYFEYHFYKQQFAKLGVKQVATVTSYMRPTIISAAKDLGISTIEIEYAALLDYHRGYYHKGNNYPFASDYFLAWNRYYADYAQLPSSIKGSFVYSDEIKYEDRAKTDYLFISQYGLTQSFIEKAIVFKKTFPEKSVVFRFHPNEPRIMIQELEQNGVSVDDKTLFESLSQAVACFGSFSTALFEAKSFGANVYIIDDSSSFYIDTYIKDGVFTDLSNISDFIEATQKPFKLWENGDIDIFDAIPMVAPDVTYHKAPAKWIKKYNEVVERMSNSGRLISLPKTSELLLSIIIPNMTSEMDYSISNCRAIHNIEIVKAASEVSVDAKYVLDASDMKRFYLNSLDLVMFVLAKVNVDALICNNLYADLIERSKFAGSLEDAQFAMKLSKSFVIKKNGVDKIEKTSLFANMLGVVAISTPDVALADEGDAIKLLNKMGNEKLAETLINAQLGENYFEKTISNKSNFIVKYNVKHAVVTVENEVKTKKFAISTQHDKKQKVFVNEHITPGNVTVSKGVPYKMKVVDGKIIATQNFTTNFVIKMSKTAKKFAKKIIRK